MSLKMKGGTLMDPVTIIVIIIAVLALIVAYLKIVPQATEYVI